MGQASQHLLLKIGKYCQGHQYDVIIFNLWGMMEDHLKVTKFFFGICHYFLKEGGYLCLLPLVMIEFVIIRLGRVGVNVVLIDVIKYAVFFFEGFP